MLTAIDQIANQNHLQMFKAAVPYLDASCQQTVSVWIKLLELENVLAFYRQAQKADMAACSLNLEAGNLTEILKEIRIYCDKKEQEWMDQCISLIHTLEFYTVLTSQPEAAADHPSEQKGDLL